MSQMQILTAVTGLRVVHYKRTKNVTDGLEITSVIILRKPEVFRTKPSALCVNVRIPFNKYLLRN